MNHFRIDHVIFESLFPNFQSRSGLHQCRNFGSCLHLDKYILILSVKVTSRHGVTGAKHLYRNMDKKKQRKKLRLLLTNIKPGLLAPKAWLVLFSSKRPHPQYLWLNIYKSMKEYNSSSYTMIYACH